MRRRAGFARSAVVLVVLAVGCGGGGSKQAAGPSGGGTDALATLQVISTQVAVKTSADFTPANSGQSLSQGSQVRTDPQGFAEVTFFEGSWMRVESGATLTIASLVDADQGQAVNTGIDTGRSWQRVEKLSESGEEFEVSTPVATAAVRGTAFAIDCTSPSACTFSVVEGEVELRLPDGTTVTLRAGQQLTITRNQAPGAPQDVGVAALQQDVWIATNLALDTTKTGGGEAFAPDDVVGTYILTRTVVASNNPEIPVGTVDTATHVIRCAGSPCVLEAGDWSNLELVGSVLRSTGSIDQACGADFGTGTVGLDFNIVLRATAFIDQGGRRVPSRFEGTELLSAPRIPPTCNAINVPITYSVVLERQDPAAAGDVPASAGAGTPSPPAPPPAPPSAPGPAPPNIGGG